MRLHPDNLARLPAAVARPGYDRGALVTGIVHLGLGAFHRAHQAVYTEDVLARKFGPWGILGVSLRNPDTRDALGPQGGLYTVASRDGSGDALRVIGAVQGCLVARESPALLLDVMCAPEVRIVSLTITEKGYCHDPATGELNLAHPDIVHDLAHPDLPLSAPGFIVEALARRRAAGTPPFTVLSCDNLPHNGALTAGLVAALAKARDPDLGKWVAAEVAFPSTMVDRIVPATTDDDRALVRAGLGMEDAWPVMAEPFKQWVIEDRFTMGRPAWETAGAEFVSDVAPYELMKLRLLNGSHSSLAYLGYLGGFATIAETVAQPDYARHTRALMAAVAPTVPVRPGYDLAGYQAQLMERFANPALKHRTWQIAMDGSQKLPQRLLGSARDLLKAGKPVDRIALGVAGWMRYVTGVDERGEAIEVSDPLAKRLAAIFAEIGPDPEKLAAAYLAVEEVFGDLAHVPGFAAPVTDALARLYAKGARATLADMP
ncbi:putative sugar dehydrogenase, NAD-dependent [uncultured Alphaproteobacteria bacterium]|uniref:Putative sugar dehydrogenase, NAD-dependent n=1 Tax=uncultured Alphaproteobacteria bacterium TaxID=91750 RepID=A0A212JD68_9PROT|nr:putative sugar dehydrogenase, NAD-dependent [uncultured Alphaproteobacteria bacterium]